MLGKFHDNFKMIHNVYTFMYKIVHKIIVHE